MNLLIINYWTLHNADLLAMNVCMECTSSLPSHVFKPITPSNDAIALDPCPKIFNFLITVEGRDERGQINGQPIKRKDDNNYRVLFQFLDARPHRRRY
jgi:hypothetical protein